MINVLLVDDHASIRKALRTFLETTEDIKLIAEAPSGAEALLQAQSQCPDVAVVDVSTPQMDGIETARRLREICPSTCIMMLSIYDQPEYVQRALDVGAVGYVLKETIAQDFLASIRSIAGGRRYFSERVSRAAEHYFEERDKDT